MKLIVGGIAQGKLERAIEMTSGAARVADGSTVEVGELACIDVLNRFHLLVQRSVRENGDAMQLVREVMEINPGIIVVCDEVGMGIVPIDRSERIWREAVGRALCELARSAEVVERVVCGIPICIKG